MSESKPAVEGTQPQLQCPFCSIRLPNELELSDHVEEVHDNDWKLEAGYYEPLDD